MSTYVSAPDGIAERIYSPVPCVISFKFLGDLQSYIFLESLEPTEPEK